MSYKFTLDHRLAFDNVHDMITIDMRPVTQCTVLKDTIQMTGHFGFEGTYLTTDLEEAPFAGTIPIDITLPYFGGATDIRVEMATFDYHVINKESLTLRFDMMIAGYEEQPQVMDAIVTEHVPEPEVEEEEEIPYSPLIPVTPENMRQNEEEEAQETQETTLEELDLDLEEELLDDLPPFFNEVDDFYKRTPEPELLLEEMQIPVAEEPPEIRPQLETLGRLMEDQWTEEPLEVEVEEELEPTTSVIDSVARQFSDGQTTVKMVYIRRESERLDEVLERNGATSSDVWNLSQLEDVVHAGDCVMIKYDKTE